MAGVFTGLPKGALHRLVKSVDLEGLIYPVVLGVPLDFSSLFHRDYHHPWLLSSPQYQWLVLCCRAVKGHFKA